MFLKEKINRLWQDRFWRNGLVFLLGSFLAGLGGYIFQLLMARLLSKPDYGELQALFAVIGVLTVPLAALNTVLVRYVARFRMSGQPAKIGGLVLFFTRKGLFLAGILFFVFAGLSPFIAQFLNLPSAATILILSLAIFPLFLGAVNRGAIQGLENFKGLSFLSAAEIILRILLAVFLIKIGLGVMGALGATVLAAVAAYFLTYPLLKAFLKERKEAIEKTEAEEILKYFSPVFLTILLLSLLFLSDMILVKHFFSPEAAGNYGALALVARIIFFIASPIVAVMFPLTAGARIVSEAKRFLARTVFTTFVLSMPVLFFYFLFPGFVIKILVSGKFTQISPFLGWLGLAMFLYSLINVFSQYFLSLGKSSYLFPLAGGIVFQVVLISFWHKSFSEVIAAVCLTMAATLIGLFTLYLKDVRKKTWQN